jgi:hypothetical protein
VQPVGSATHLGTVGNEDLGAKRCGHHARDCGCEREPSLVKLLTELAQLPTPPEIRDVRYLKRGEAYYIDALHKLFVSTQDLTEAKAHFAKAEHLPPALHWQASTGWPALPSEYEMRREFAKLMGRE